jgi:hypothetical protein
MRSGHFEDAAYSGGHPRPGFGFEFELFAAFAGEAIEAGAPAKLGDGPLGRDPALVFQAMERRVKGPLIDAKYILRNLLNSLGNRPSVLGARLEGTKDKKIERSLKEGRVGGLSHIVGCLQQADCALVVVECQQQNQTNQMGGTNGTFGGLVPRGSSLISCGVNHSFTEFYMIPLV